IVESLAWACVTSHPESFEPLYGPRLILSNRPASCLHVPSNLQGRPIIESAPGAFNADCAYASMFETRVRDIVQSCRVRRALLFVDDLHVAVQIGWTIAGA